MPAEPDGEGRRIIERAERDSQDFLSGRLEQARRHFSGGDADPADRVELWGRRIGRLLSLVGAVVLAILLLRHFAGS
jgi:hypothetical protein